MRSICHLWSTRHLWSSRHLWSIRHLWFLLVVCVTVRSQFQALNNFKIPPGSRVEFELEIDPPLPGQGQTSGGAAPSSMTSQQAPASTPATATAQSPVQQLLSNMMRMYLPMRQRMGGLIANMEVPCPCDTDCCSMPTEPRRVLPVLDVPMTTHLGCCGCVDCPLSLNPFVSNMLRYAQMMGNRQQSIQSTGK